MAGILVNHQVENYETWLKGFDAHEKVRKEYGIKTLSLWQAADDPNNVFILFEHDDLNKLRQFAMSEDLKQTMLRAGVIGIPTIYYLKNVRKQEVTRGATG